MTKWWLHLSPLDSSPSREYNNILILLMPHSIWKDELRQGCELNATSAPLLIHQAEYKCSRCTLKFFKQSTQAIVVHVIFLVEPFASLSALETNIGAQNTGAVWDVFDEAISKIPNTYEEKRTTLHRFENEMKPWKNFKECWIWVMSLKIRELMILMTQGIGIFCVRARTRWWSWDENRTCHIGNHKMFKWNSSPCRQVEGRMKKWWRDKRGWVGTRKKEDHHPKIQSF